MAKKICKTEQIFEKIFEKSPSFSKDSFRGRELVIKTVKQKDIQETYFVGVGVGGGEGEVSEEFSKQQSFERLAFHHFLNPD